MTVADHNNLTDSETASLALNAPLDELCEMAVELRNQGHGNVITYSKKVFIPLTRLCRDVCHYCTYAKTPQRVSEVYLDREQVLQIAQQGVVAGCREALLTLGDKPELRYAVARDELRKLGHKTTLSYLAGICELIYAESGLFPHVNAGVMSAADIAMLREVSVSQGLMLESVSERLLEPGRAHYGSPDKQPALRLGTIAAAGELKVPFTSGILIGIGETRAERIDTLFALRDAHRAHGHIQEVIVQNFRAKPDTVMAQAAEPTLDEHCRTIAMARIIFGANMNIQAPPNLQPGNARALINAGINDFGGISPVTPDYVNPEAPWPQLRQFADEVAAAGHSLNERLAVYPEYLADKEQWVAAKFHRDLITTTDSAGLPRTDSWAPGTDQPLPSRELGYLSGRHIARIDAGTSRILERAGQGERLSSTEIVALFKARDREFSAVARAADLLRQELAGDTVTYVVNRNINYTNLCYFRCKFCAFSKGSTDEALRGRPYDLSLDEIQRRALEAWQRGATEVCLQGGIHPDYTGNTYLEICRGIKQKAPDIHIHAFSPLEIWQGAQTLNMDLGEFLALLKSSGLSSLPGTAAEILHDEVRQQICPDKITTSQWFEVMHTAHGLGLRSTATIMFGHVDEPRHWAAHLLGLRSLQEQTGGFTEFVPLPFVHMQAPMFLRSISRAGPTLRESVLMHSVARLVFGRLIPNVQTSWVKMGREGSAVCLNAGANDIGGTLMNESITRAAGTVHGQEFSPSKIEETIRSMGRQPEQRTTLYEPAPEARTAAAMSDMPLLRVNNQPALKHARIR